ncbi:MAG: hypothetical protein PWQ10_32 [Patescibacteria group bacterium]|nr:hypothetical protein [Patescibacteria group bacterium]
MSQCNNNSINQPKNDGFTAVEILIIAPIVVLVIGIFITLIVNMTNQVLITKAADSLTYNVQNALNLIEQDVKSSNGFLTTNSFDISSPQGYNDDTTKFQNTEDNTVLIISSYATTGSPLSSNRSVVYLADSPNACTSQQVDNNDTIPINIVYFIKNNTLWRRTIMPSNYINGCDPINKTAITPWQQPSCSATASDTLSFCKTKDMNLVNGVGTNGLNVNYYTDPSATDINTTASDTATTISVTITATNFIAGNDISRSNTVRATIPK